MRSNQSARKVTARALSPERIDLGTWQMLEGRGLTTEVSKRREGGAMADYLTGGLPSREAATLQRHEIRDGDPALRRRLEQLTHRGPIVVEITEVVLDVEKVPTGDGETYRGMVQQIGHIQYDANSGEPADWQLTVELESEAA